MFILFFYLSNILNSALNDKKYFKQRKKILSKIFQGWKKEHILEGLK